MSSVRTAETILVGSLQCYLLLRLAFLISTQAFACRHFPATIRRTRKWSAACTSDLRRTTGLYVWIMLFLVYFTVQFSVKSHRLPAGCSESVDGVPPLLQGRRSVLYGVSEVQIELYFCITSILCCCSSRYVTCSRVVCLVDQRLLH